MFLLSGLAWAKAFTATYPASNKPSAKKPAFPFRTRRLPNMSPPVSSPQRDAHTRRIAQIQFKFCRVLAPARDSRVESVHLKPLPTYNFESDTVPPATAGCGLYAPSPNVMARQRLRARLNNVRRMFGPERFTY